VSGAVIDIAGSLINSGTVLVSSGTLTLSGIVANNKTSRRWAQVQPS